jgi:hypothetical protein
MTFPAKPKTPYDYVSFQTGRPTDPLPANQVASDFVSHKTSIDALVDFSKLVQRSDGRLNNGSVRPETLSAGTVALIGKWAPRGNWLTATAYAVNDLVTESNNLYVCIVAHTSGTFATDLADGCLDESTRCGVRCVGANRFRRNRRRAARHVDGAVEVHRTVEIGGAAEGVGACEGVVSAATASCSTVTERHATAAAGDASPVWILAHRKARSLCSRVDFENHPLHPTKTSHTDVRNARDEDSD